MNTQILALHEIRKNENRFRDYPFLVRFAILALAVLISGSLVHAQSDVGEVLGTVRDSTGALVPGATVTLTNQGTGIQGKTTTDDQGSYDLLNVKFGAYQVAVEHAGFSKFTTDIRLEVGVRQRVDVTMQLGGLSETIVVSEVALPLDTDSSERGQIINTAAVAELPLNGRNYADLALLSPNTIKSPMAFSFSPTGTPREGAFNVNGMRSTYNNFLLDGSDNNAYSTSNQGYSAQVVQPSPDAIAEFKVITSNYAAEYGRVGGAVVSAVMKSGTNQFHGSAYEYLRNTVLNARGFEFSPVSKIPFQRNQFGMSVGGPFIKNRLFFFGDYEGFRQLQRYNNYDSIPTANDRSGILPVSVVDPWTGTLYTAGTQIPVATLNPFALTVLGQLPITNNGTTRANDLYEQLQIRDFSDKFDAKIDGQINDRMSMFLRFSQRKDFQYYQPDIPGPAGGNGSGNLHSIDQNATLGYTWTVRSSSVFDARFGWSRIQGGKAPVTIGQGNMLSLYGIPGLPTASNLAGGLNSQNISGFAQLGRQTSNPQFQNPTSFGPKFSFSQVIGRHSLKMGFEYLVIRTPILDINPLYGEDQFTGQFSKPTCTQLGLGSGCAIASDPTSYNLADFIFSTPSIINLGNYLVVNLRQHVTSLFFQDDYRMTSKLTLNLGLRWDYATPLYERDNNYSNFDPNTDMMVHATSGSIRNRSLVNPDYKDWGPRIGLAYSVTPTTVLRSGYGISYDYFNRVGSALEGINAPQALFGVINQSITPGSAPPPGFLTTQNSFTTGIDNPANFNPAVSNVVYIPPQSRWPYIQTWFFSVQQKLPWDTMVEVAYNGNHSLRLPILADYNQASPNSGGSTLSYSARLPIPNFGPITWVDPVGNNHYDGLSVRVEKRFTKGFYFLNSFTYGSAIGDSEQALEYYAGYFEANPQNIHNLNAEAGPSSFDVKYNDVVSMVYQLPVGKGRQYASKMNAVEDSILGGWEVNAINDAHTGTPLNVFYSPSGVQEVSSLSNDYRGQPFLRPNETGSATPQTKYQRLSTFFAGYSFAAPAGNYPWGNLSRNAFRAPGFEQLDLSIDKTFQIHESLRLQFRSEFFNVLNITNFGIPNTISTSSSFGTITTTYPARQIQFALKLLF